MKVKTNPSQVSRTTRASTSARPPARNADAQHAPRLLRLPDGSRSVQSPWVWRGFLFLSFIAFGLCLTFAFGNRAFYAASWGFVTAGWFAISMWLWRKHVRDDDEWRARQHGGRTR